MRLKILSDREAIQWPIHGGVCPVSVSPPVSPPPPPPPPGEPHLIGTSPGTTASLWISGALLRFRSGDGNEYGETGVSLPAAPGAVRSLKFSAENIEYLDDSGVARRISTTSFGAKPAPAIAQSIYYEAGETTPRVRVRWIGVTNFYKWHNGF